jgi:hypothetical protein
MSSAGYLVVSVDTGTGTVPELAGGDACTTGEMKCNAAVSVLYRNLLNPGKEEALPTGSRRYSRLAACATGGITGARPSIKRTGVADGVEDE